MRQSIRIGRNIGAVIGVIGFLLVGLVPGFYFGSYGTVVLLSGIAGGPLGTGVMVRMAVVLGTLLGLFVVFTVFTTVGASLGAALGYLSEAATEQATDETAATEKAG